MHKKAYGFTIVELLIVIVIIAILAAISIVAYTGVQERSQKSKVQSDAAQIIKAITLAREQESKPLKDITGQTYTASACTNQATGTNLANLARTHACWTAYLAALDAISNASGMDVRNIVDPWGSPYHIDENEGDGGGTVKDTIGVYFSPHRNLQRRDWLPVNNVPLSGYR